jgi:hypothetical protein
MEDGRPVFSFSVASFDEILRAEKRDVCRFEFRETTSIRRIIDREVRHLQCGLDAKRAARGDPVCYADGNLEGCGFVGRNLLNDAHPEHPKDRR